MKTLGRIVLVGAALMMPMGLEAQPRRNVDGRFSVRVVVRPEVRGGWVDARWGRLDMYVPRARLGRVHLGERGLRDVLGHRTVKRIRHMARRDGLRGRMTGVLTTTRRQGSVLEVRVHGRDVLRLRDFNRDGYVDRVLVPRRLAR